MSKLHQLGPAVFNIGNDIQQKMVENLLDSKFGYGDNDKIALWKKTQREFVDEGRNSSVYKYNKLYKKKKDANEFYKNKLEKDLNNSGMSILISLRPWLTLGGLNGGNYGSFQTIINTFLYEKQNNDYYEWALDTKKFKGFAQSIKEMYRDIEIKDLSKIKRDIAKNNKKFEIEARSGLIEASLNITRQCFDSCGRKPNNNAYCYICGEIIDSESGEDASGSQCEHVVPVTSLAALCGLSGPDYEKTIDAYFEKNKELDGTVEVVDGNGIKITREAYKLWRDILIGPVPVDGKIRRVDEAFDHGGGKRETGVMYRWAHPACNMIKKDHAFLGLNWTAAKDDDEWNEMAEIGFPILDEDEYCDRDGIEYVLKCLANEPINGKRGGGGSNSSKWRARFKDHLLNAPMSENVLGPAWVQERYNAMKENTMKWAMYGVLSKGIDGVFKAQYKKAPSEGGGFVTEEEWPLFRTSLCDLSMKILDFRVEEKIKVHYKKFITGTVTDDDLQEIIEEWRKADWIDLVGESNEAQMVGGARTALNKKGREGIEFRELRVKGKKRDIKEKEKKKKKEKSELRSKRTAIAMRKRFEPYTTVSIEEEEPYAKRFETKGEHRKWCEENDRIKFFDVLEELNDEKILLSIYFDVFDSVTVFEDERICRAKLNATDYRDNFYDHIDRDALNFEMLQAINALNFEMLIDDVSRGQSKRKKKKKGTKAKKKNTGKKKKKPTKKKKNTKGKRKLTKRRKRYSLSGYLS